MTPLRFVAPFVLLSAAWTPAWSYASVQVAQSPQQNMLAPYPATAHEPQDAAQASDKAIFTVGVGDPDTQLILPRFLTDLINAVNARSSPDELMHTLARGP
jgi:hypothetical protein